MVFLAATAGRDRGGNIAPGIDGQLGHGHDVAVRAESTGREAAGAAGDVQHDLHCEPVEFDDSARVDEDGQSAAMIHDS